MSSNQWGVGFFGILTLIFITLKLTNYIAWSWWWILGPIWIPTLLVFFLAVMVRVVVEMSDEKPWRK